MLVSINLEGCHAIIYIEQFPPQETKMQIVIAFYRNGASNEFAPDLLRIY
jgi:hypothetical protein